MDGDGLGGGGGGGGGGGSEHGASGVRVVTEPVVAATATIGGRRRGREGGRAGL